MNKGKPKKYHVVVWNNVGQTESGIPAFSPKYVSEWPKRVIPYESRYELSPDQEDALCFGRDQALEVARTIRLRSVVWSAMVEEA